MNQVRINHEKRMDDVRAFIRKHWEDHHYAPTIAEIAAALGGISTNTISYYVEKLVKSGWLEPRTKGTGRGHGAARNIVPSEIFRDRPVFPVYVQGIDIGVGEDQSVEVLIEKMTDGLVAIVKAKKVNTKELAVKSGQFYQTGKSTEFPGISDFSNINTIPKETP